MNQNTDTSCVESKHILLRVTRHASFIVVATLVTATSNAATLTASAAFNLTKDYSTSSINLGVNMAAWDSHMTSDVFYSGPTMHYTTASDLRNAGVQVMRYPGGSTADNFHWYNQTVAYPSSSGVPGSGDLGSNGATGVNFDQYMSVVQQAGAQAMITVNYGSGTPQEAANWVAYADNNLSGYQGTNPTYAGASNTGHAYGIKYWEIGNEVYGNGTYGTGTNIWELDNHTTLGGTYYGQQVVAYSQAMKAINPSILIGAVLVPPTNWPQTTSTTSTATGKTVMQTGTWDQSVLQAACNSIDFVDIHWYPQAPAGSGQGHEDDAQLLASPQDGAVTDSGASRTFGIQSMMHQLDMLMMQYCSGRTNPNPLQIFVTETNSVYDTPGTQTTSVVNALFEADNIMTWLEYGVANVDWWAAHNSASNGATTNMATGAPLYGSYNFGDYGLLAVGGTTTVTNTHTGLVSTITEPAAETPFPAYYGMQMLSRVLASNPNYAGTPFFSNYKVYTTNPANQVSVHAVAQLGNNLRSGATPFNSNVLLINKDPANSYATTVSVGTYAPGPYGITASSATTYGPNGLVTNVTLTLTPTAFTVTLPPYSMTVVNVTGVAAP